MRKTLFLLSLVLACIPTYAQQSLWDNRESVSPQIHTDHTVTFRLQAPQARQVEITGDFLAQGVAGMVKNEQGVWEYTTPQPLPSELYYYNFILDGVKVTDPASVYMIRDVASVMSIFIIEGGRGDCYKVNAVPHGTVARRWYDSPTLNSTRRITIYTPPGYEAGKENYPVLYLLHGSGGDEEAWIALGRTAQILDNLIAQGKARPMIVVMTNGNADQEAAPGESSLGFYKPGMTTERMMKGSFEKAFPDVIQFVESNYRTIPQKAARAICGLSMGGFHSLHISKEYPGLFDYIGLFSAAILPHDNVKSPVYDDFDAKLKTQFDQQPQLYWIAIGKTDFLYQPNVDFRKKLDENHYPYTYYETEGGHIWKNWRIYLSEFVTMIFK